VLAQRGRRGETTAGVREPDHRRERLDRADFRVLPRQQDLARRDLRMLEGPGDRDAAARHVLRLEAGGQLLDGEAREDSSIASFSASRWATRSVLVRNADRRATRGAPSRREADPQRRVRDGDDDQPNLRAQRW
jgi:hypothetical protein